MCRHFKVLLSFWALTFTINVLFVGSPFSASHLRFFLNAPQSTFYSGLALGVGVGCLLGLLASAWIRTHSENGIVYIGWGVEAVFCTYYFVVFYLGSFLFYDVAPPFNICHLLSFGDPIHCTVTAATFRVATDFFLFGFLFFWGLHYEGKTGKELRYQLAWVEGDPEYARARESKKGPS